MDRMLLSVDVTLNLMIFYVELIYQIRITFSFSQLLSVYVVMENTHTVVRMVMSGSCV